MEAFRSSELGHLSLSAGVDGDAMHYHVHDRRNGRIFRVDREIALALHGLRNGRRPTADDDQDAGPFRRLFGFLKSNRHMLETEQSRAKPFNPLFIQMPLVDLGRWQPAFEGVARLLVGPQFFVLFGLLTIAASVLASSQDWAILSQFGQIFSLSALASFALVAPILKLFHEFGHFLVATRYKVQVRDGGLYFIGLYPMPFVDCSMADLQANRGQRIAISLAGLAVDLSVALMALIAWHFAPGGFGKTLLANIFFFSSLNSVLFNGNPLIKLDGYYALSDWIGQRNLGTRAQARLKRVMRWVTHLGADGDVPRTREGAGLATFGLLSMFYRINILLTIAWIMLPRFFGLGIVLVAWGAYVMFLSPMLSTSSGAVPPRRKGAARRRAVFWGGLIGGIAALLLLVRVPYIVVLPLQLDRADTYEVSYNAGGPARAQIARFAPDGGVAAGDVLLSATSLDLDQSDTILAAEQAFLTVARDAVQGIDPAETLAATERLRLIESQQVSARLQREALEIRAPGDGVFAAQSDLGTGAILTDGQVIGAFYPHDGAAVLTGQFPDRYVELFRTELTDLEFRVNGGSATGFDLVEYGLIEIANRDAETGGRSFAFRAVVDVPAARVVGSEVFLRLQIGDAPLRDHVLFFLNTLWERYWDARIALNSAI